MKELLVDVARRAGAYLDSVPWYESRGAGRHLPRFAEICLDARILL